MIIIKGILKKTLLSFLCLVLLIIAFPSLMQKEKNYPIVDGTFIQADMVRNWDDAMWQKEFQYLKEAGMNYLIIQSASKTMDKVTKTIYPTTIRGFQMEEGYRDVLDVSLRNAEKSGIKVFIGINFNKKWWGKYGNDEKWLYEQMKIGNLIADEIYSLYHSKYPNSFYGWYWAYEVDNVNFKTEKQFDVLSKAININLKHLEQKNIRLPVMISPFMNSKGSTPKEFANGWRYVFRNTGLGEEDIFCPQDSVGAGGVNIKDVGGWFKEFKKAVNTKSGLKFWANAENFDRSTWSSSSLRRFIEQLKIEWPYVDNIVTFSYSHYYSPNNIDEAFHKTYLDYVRNGYIERNKPTSPSYVKVKKLKNKGYYISWGESKDDTGVYGYRLYRNGKLIFTTQIQRLYGGKEKDIVMSFEDSQELDKGEFGIIYKVTAFDFVGNESSPRQYFVLKSD